MSLFKHEIYLPLIESGLVTDPTRAALLERIAQDGKAYTPAFFNAEEMTALLLVCARLLGESAQAGRQNAASIFAAREIDKRLASGAGDGWRYDALPSDGEAYRFGLALLVQGAEASYGKPLRELPDDAIDRLLHDLQAGRLRDASAPGFDSGLWFGDLLAEAVENYYAHPESQREIGYVGFADAPGWTRTGLNQLESRETVSADERA